MRESGAPRQHPELKQLVVEASRALSCLDAERLEELALSCQALNRALEPASADQRRDLARQAREAAGDMAVFARVLEATQANLKVMNRLRELRAGRLEYAERAAGAARVWAGTESGHGNH
jgi:hypothetical protein